MNLHTPSHRFGPGPSEEFSASRKLLSNELSHWWRQLFRLVWVNLVFTSLLFWLVTPSTMINTFHTSFSPPPVPPRQGHKGPILATNSPLVKFLSVMLLLLMLITFGGFLYLFHRLNMYQTQDMTIVKPAEQCMKDIIEPKDMQYCKTLAEFYYTVIQKVSRNEGQTALLTGTRSPNVQARLTLRQDNSQSKTSDMLVWDPNHSLLEKVSLSLSGFLTIEHTGYYFIYSQVTFSKNHEKVPLKQALWSTKSEDKRAKAEQLLVSFCNLPRDNSIPALCTASQSGVFGLEKGQQLFVNVTDRSLVNPGNTNFGLFKLKD